MKVLKTDWIGGWARPLSDTPLLIPGLHRLPVHYEVLGDLGERSGTGFLDLMLVIIRRHKYPRIHSDSNRKVLIHLLYSPTRAHCAENITCQLKEQIINISIKKTGFQ